MQKRGHTDAELQAIVDEQLEQYLFPFERLPSDLVYHMIFKSGLSVADMHRLCNINKRFHAICIDRYIWDKVFIDKFLAKEKNTTDAEREAYLQSEEFKAWKLDSRRMPEAFVHLLAYSLFTIHNTADGPDPHIFFLYKQVGASALRINLIRREDDTLTVSVLRLPDRADQRKQMLSKEQQPDDFTAIFKKYGKRQYEAIAGIPKADGVFICYQLLQSGWTPHKDVKKSFLECAACRSPNIRFTCKDCKNFAVCSYACSDSVAAEHDAVCH